MDGMRGRRVRVAVVVLTAIGAVLLIILSVRSRFGPCRAPAGPSGNERPERAGPHTSERTGAETRPTVGIREPERPAAGVCGVVFDARGLPAPNASISVFAGTRRVAFGPAIQSDDQGAFAISAEASDTGGGPLWVSARRGESISDQIRVDGSELASVPWIAVALRGSCRVTARAVDEAARSVAAPEFLVIVLPAPRTGEDWGRSVTGSYIRALGSESGELDLRVPPGKIRISARAPDGLFGPQARGSVSLGGDWAAGDVPVAAARFVARLVVTDQAGNPIDGAGVRVQRGDNLQRLIGDQAQPSHRLLHYVTDREGRVRLPFGCDPKPAWIAIGSARHAIVRAAIGRATPGEREYSIRLAARSRIPIRVQLANGDPVPADVKMRWRRIRHKLPRGMGKRRPRFESLFLGVARDEAGSVTESIPPESFLTTVFRKRYPIPDGDSSSYSAYVDGPGRCRLELALPPGISIRSEVELESDVEESRPVKLVIPQGRPVEIRCRASSGEGSAPFVWAGRDGWPPATWPKNRSERRRLLAACGSLEFDAHAQVFGGVFWIPAACEQLVLGRSGAAGDVAMTRRALPRGLSVRAVIELPLPPLARSARGMTIRLLSSGRPLRQAGIPLIVRVEGAPERRLASDLDGKFALEVEQDVVEVIVPVPPAPGWRKRIVMGESGQTVDLDLGAR